MISKRIIELAVEGGWDYWPFMTEGDGLETWLKLDADKDWHKIALDKTFWQALGKSLGKNGIEYPISGGIALVDPESVTQLNEWSWYVQKGYARGTKKDSKGNKTIFMHRLILGHAFKTDELTDHINGNRLDNRNSNLRVVDAQTNALNKATTINGKYRGVYYNKNKDLYQGVVGYCKTKYSVGYFKDRDVAADATRKFRVRLHGVTNPLSHEWWYINALRFCYLTLTGGDLEEYWNEILKV